MENLRITDLYLQRENRKEDKDQLVIVLLNMLEVVTRDIMEDSVPRYDATHAIAS